LSRRRGGGWGQAGSILGDPETSASAYGRCVAAASAGSAELRRDVCLREFQALRECFARACLPKTLEILI
uniref:Uncharacterized protein n=1 Tax=Pavo cristatus TaxID=9049 RepID=A0A8C9LBB2_PAVCR